LATALGQGGVAVLRRIRAVRDNCQALLEVREFGDDSAVFDWVFASAGVAMIPPRRAAIAITTLIESGTFTSYTTAPRISER
jgi:hypothetical protein